MRVFSNTQIIILIFLLLSMTIILKSKYNEGFTNDTLPEGSIMNSGSGLTSKNGKYRLDFGLDGTLKVIQLATDETNAIVTDNDSIKVSTKWNSGIKPVTYDSVLELTDGNLSVLDEKGQSRWDTKTKDTGGNSSKLKMRDDGILAIYGVDNIVIWSSEKILIKEGLMNVNTTDAIFDPKYKTDIADKRALLKKNTDELVQLKDPSNKIHMDKTIFINILATVLASSMIYYAVISN